MTCVFIRPADIFYCYISNRHPGSRSCSKFTHHRFFWEFRKKFEYQTPALQSVYQRISNKKTAVFIFIIKNVCLLFAYMPNIKSNSK